MNPLAWLPFAGGAAIGGLILFGVQELRMYWNEDQVRLEERQAQEKICDDRIAGVQKSLAEDSLAKVDAANSIVAGLTETPEDPVERQKLCDGESACRDRKSVP